MWIAGKLAVAMCALGIGQALAAPAKKPGPARPGRSDLLPPSAEQPAPSKPSKPAERPDRPTDQPGKPEEQPDKLDAKSLMQSGLRLYAARDFLGALAVFRIAYARFPSAKILLNIGTTLTRLDRKAEAANVYQRYLDSSDVDPAKQAEVKKVLAALDAAVAILELTITPADAELQINDEEWIAAAAPRQRVAPGPIIVRARHPAYLTGEQYVTATSGAKLPIAIALVELPPPPPPPPAAAVIPVDTGVRATVDVEQPRSPLGVIALAHIDIANPGAAGMLGVTADVTERLQVKAGALVARRAYGGYAGASFAVLTGTVRPIVAAGVPIFASQGARVSIRGAGGVELALGRHLAVIAELGVEYLFNPEGDRQRTLFIPAIGASGRL